MFNMEKEEEIVFFSKLPIDMRNEIFSYLNPLDIFCNVFNVCKNWRFQLCNFYLRNNCKKFIEFYNIENIEEFIINLINDKKLFLKFKKYLFNQQVSQLSCELQKLQLIDKNNIYLINKNNITIILKDLYKYYSLINEHKHYLSKKRNDNNYSTVDNISPSVTSCFGSDLKLNNANNHNNNTNIDTSLNTLLPNYLKNDNNLIRFKSIFIGDYNIGKTCFLKATSSKTFDNNIGNNNNYSGSSGSSSGSGNNNTFNSSSPKDQQQQRQPHENAYYNNNRRLNNTFSSSSNNNHFNNNNGVGNNSFHMNHSFMGNNNSINSNNNLNNNLNNTLNNNNQNNNNTGVYSNNSSVYNNNNNGYNNRGNNFNRNNRFNNLTNRFNNTGDYNNNYNNNQNNNFNNNNYNQNNNFNSNFNDNNNYNDNNYNENDIYIPNYDNNNNNFGNNNYSNNNYGNNNNNRNFNRNNNYQNQGRNNNYKFNNNDQSIINKDYNFNNNFNKDYNNNFNNNGNNQNRNYNNNQQQDNNNDNNYSYNNGNNNSHYKNNFKNNFNNNYNRNNKNNFNQHNNMNNNQFNNEDEMIDNFNSFTTNNLLNNNNINNNIDNNKTNKLINNSFNDNNSFNLMNNNFNNNDSFTNNNNSFNNRNNYNNNFNNNFNNNNNQNRYNNNYNNNNYNNYNQYKLEKITRGSYHNVGNRKVYNNQNNQNNNNYNNNNNNYNNNNNWKRNNNKNNNFIKKEVKEITKNETVDIPIIDCIYGFWKNSTLFQNTNLYNNNNCDKNCDNNHYNKNLNKNLKEEFDENTFIQCGKIKHFTKMYLKLNDRELILKIQKDEIQSIDLIFPFDIFTKQNVTIFKLKNNYSDYNNYYNKNNKYKIVIGLNLNAIPLIFSIKKENSKNRILNNLFKEFLNLPKSNLFLLQTYENNFYFEKFLNKLKSNGMLTSCKVLQSSGLNNNSINNLNNNSINGNNNLNKNLEDFFNLNQIKIVKEFQVDYLQKIKILKSKLPNLILYELLVLESHFIFHEINYDENFLNLIENYTFCNLDTNCDTNCDLIVKKIQWNRKILMKALNQIYNEYFSKYDSRCYNPYTTLQKTIEMIQNSTFFIKNLQSQLTLQNTLQQNTQNNTQNTLQNNTQQTDNLFLENMTENDIHYANIRRIVITPCKIYFEPSQLEKTNRVIRYFKNVKNNFIRVTFMDDDFSQLNAISFINLFGRLYEFLSKGFYLYEKRFKCDFLAFSSSQLRIASCWYFLRDEKDDLFLQQRPSINSLQNGLQNNLQNNNLQNEIVNNVTSTKTVTKMFAAISNEMEEDNYFMNQNLLYQLQKSSYSSPSSSPSSLSNHSIYSNNYHNNNTTFNTTVNNTINNNNNNNNTINNKTTIITNEYLFAKDIREYMGDFSEIKVVAKYAARLGQCFSCTDLSITLKEDEYIEEKDIIRNGYCFSDGIGKISKNLSKRIYEKLFDKYFKKYSKDYNKEDYNNKDYNKEEEEEMTMVGAPCAYQIRFGGAKGMVVLDPTLKHKEMVLRKSQIKFPSCHTDLEIVDFSKRRPGFLNRQIITILNCLNVKDSKFIKLQENMYEKLHLIKNRRDEALQLILSMSHSRLNEMIKFLLENNLPMNEPFISRLLQCFRFRCLKDLKDKSRLYVEKSSNLTGVLDEYCILKENQVYINLSKVQGNSSYGCIKGKVFVTKNPCFHPGDIRVCEAIGDCKELSHLQNVIVFPQVGERPITNQITGSDLDGDCYFVCWDPELIPPIENETPMDFTGNEDFVEKKVDDKVTVDDIVHFFIDYITNDNLGKIANAHLAHSDTQQEGIYSNECLELARLHSIAVDATKTGITVPFPNELFLKSYPDFMQNQRKKVYVSSKVLGYLFRSVLKHAPEVINDSTFISSNLCTEFNYSLFDSYVDTTISKEEEEKNINNKVEKRNQLLFDKQFIVEGYEKYLKETLVLYNTYCSLVRNDMRKYGIKDEVQIISGWISLPLRKTFRKNQRDVEATISINIDLFMNHMKTKFYEMLDKYGADKELEIASAWYFVAYSSDSDFENVMKKVQEEEEEQQTEELEEKKNTIEEEEEKKMKNEKQLRREGLTRNEWEKLMDDYSKERILSFPWINYESMIKILNRNIIKQQREELALLLQQQQQELNKEEQEEEQKKKELNKEEQKEEEEENNLLKSWKPLDSNHFVNEEMIILDEEENRDRDFNEYNESNEWDYDYTDCFDQEN
ncbi:hypothetical protein ABK040_016899 [Willaertia magna]